MSRRPRWGLYLLVGGVFALLALASQAQGPASSVLAQACPPRCDTPIVTPAWHVHMCDVPYAAQVGDNHCMQGDGVTDFPDGTEQVYILYCHSNEDLVVVQVKDAAGGLQYINHPDGMTYRGSGCETLLYSRRGGIRPSGSPYYTSAYWPEGPFVGVGRGIEWFVGLFVAFDASDYYGETATAVLTARDPAASTDPLVTETIAVRVSSSTDPIGFDVVLAEEFPDDPIFRSLAPLRFSKESSDPASGSLHVSDHDVITMSYCPRDCETPYTVTAAWYDMVATVTPTNVPTRHVVTPTPTATAPPQVRVETITIRPKPEDVGYVPQQSANRNLVNHLGYPTIYVGMWTHGANAHYGMVQFDLGDVPENAHTIEARLELIGRDRRFVEPGAWSVQLLGTALDASWRTADFAAVSSAPVLAQIGSDLSDEQLAEEEATSFGFSEDQLNYLDQRLFTTEKLSFRIDGPVDGDNNVFGWHSGVDTYAREPYPPSPMNRPALHLRYSIGNPPPTSTEIGPGPTDTQAPETPAATATDDLATPARATETLTVTATPGTVEPVSATPGTSPPSPTVAPTSGTTVEPTIDPSAEPTAEGTNVPTAEHTAEPTASAGSAHQVCLVAYDDRDGDGARGSTERFLAGVTVRLTHVQSAAFVSWTTDGQNDPDFCWVGLADGQYVLAMVQAPHGYQVSGSSEYGFDVPIAGGPARYEFGLQRVPTTMPSSSPAPSPASASPTPSASATATLSATRTDTPGTPSATTSPTSTPPRQSPTVTAVVSSTPRGTGTQSATNTTVAPRLTPSAVPSPTIATAKGTVLWMPFALR